MKLKKKIGLGVALAFASVGAVVGTAITTVSCSNGSSTETIKKPDGTVSKKSVDYELDFLVSSLDSEIIPIEVKSRTKQRSKATSLDKYIELYNPKKVYILSPGNFAKKGNEYYIPLYSAFKLREVIK